MMGKTHSAVGVASALAVNMILSKGEPSVLGIVSAVAVGSIGALLPDIDVSRSKSHNKVEKIITALIVTIIGLGAIDWLFSVGLLNKIMRVSSQYSAISGLLLLIGICGFGMRTKHRTFMHSLLGLFLTSVCVYMIAPFFVPYFVAGFLSHVGIDLLNRRHVHMLYPIHGKGICFGCCGSNGTVNRVLGLSGTALSILLIVVQIL